MSKFDDLKTRLETVTGRRGRRVGQASWQFHCPAHADNKPSLTITPSDNGPLVYCHRGCSYNEIMDALDAGCMCYTPAEPEPQIPPWERPIAVTYNYTNEHGVLLYQKVRFADAKAFAIRRPRRPRGWYWSIGNAPRVLYQLPAVIKADTVAIVEGEKDADNLTRLGIVATCNIDGSSAGRSKWLPQYNTYLRDKHILVFADNDEPGLAHAASIIRSLQGEPLKSLTKMYPLPGLSHGGDVSDWILLGGTLGDLRQLWLKQRTKQ